MSMRSASTSAAKSSSNGTMPVASSSVSSSRWMRTEICSASSSASSSTPVQSRSGRMPVARLFSGSCGSPGCTRWSVSSSGRRSFASCGETCCGVQPKEVLRCGLVQSLLKGPVHALCASFARLSSSQRPMPSSPPSRILHQECLRRTSLQSSPHRGPIFRGPGLPGGTSRPTETRSSQHDISTTRSSCVRPSSRPLSSYQIVILPMVCSNSTPSTEPVSGFSSVRRLECCGNCHALHLYHTGKDLR
mmetsp:Transcript_11327/g.35357  ORF Transcript_11327/g.35357 Transcript_11327/m.35357 type:complete len:247 (-) Transcript_11327:368-1108(-)